MQQQRQILWFILLFLSFMIYMTWNKEHLPRESSAPASRGPVAGTMASSVSPGAGNLDINHVASILQVHTDLFDIKINMKDGEIIETDLKKFKETQQANSESLKLLSPKAEEYYVAGNLLVTKSGTQTVYFNSNQMEYNLLPSQQELQVVLTGQVGELSVQKIYTFKRDRYDVDVRYVLENHSASPWAGELRTEINRRYTHMANAGGFGLRTFSGVAYSTAEHPFEKRGFDKLKGDPVNVMVNGGWIAMPQQYFLSAWIPQHNRTHHFYSVSDEADQLAVIGARTNLAVAPGGRDELDYKFYAGPTEVEILKTVAPHLELTIDYGVFWFIAVALFWILKHVNLIVNNWGISIIAVTVLVKLLFYRLSAKSYYSMAKLREIQPELMHIRERYGNDKQKMAMETMALYREQNVNPMSGCFPVLIQIPVFIALYWVLIESVELRHAPFLLWITDLSVKDPFYVLPILMCITMFMQQRMSPPAQDPMQQKVMYAMPIIFGGLFMSFPAGLVLYWFVNNLLSLMQQWYVMRRPTN